MGDRHILKRLREMAGTITDSGVNKLERVVFSDDTVLKGHADRAGSDVRKQNRILQEVRTEMVQAETELNDLAKPIERLLQAPRSASCARPSRTRARA